MAKKKQSDPTAVDNLLDAVAAIVHQGYGAMLNGSDLRITLDGWKPNCCANYEYVFAWNPDLDIDSLKINWNRLNRQILRRVVKGSLRTEKILSGSPMTKKDQQAYRLELARRKHGYLSAQERLESGIDCQWADLSFVTDSKGRNVYILEMADAASSENEECDSIIERHQEIWHWKSQPLTTVGPFAFEEEAEQWMSANGAFDDE